MASVADQIIEAVDRFIYEWGFKPDFIVMNKVTCDALFEEVKDYLQYDPALKQHFRSFDGYPIIIDPKVEGIEVKSLAV